MAGALLVTLFLNFSVLYFLKINCLLHPFLVTTPTLLCFFCFHRKGLSLCLDMSCNVCCSLLTLSFSSLANLCTSSELVNGSGPNAHFNALFCRVWSLFLIIVLSEIIRTSPYSKNDRIIVLYMLKAALALINLRTRFR